MLLLPKPGDSNRAQLRAAEYFPATIPFMEASTLLVTF